MKKISHSVGKIVDTMGDGVKRVEQTMETVVEPARRSLLERFPVLFALLVTFGVSATFLGFERVLMEIPFIYERPWIILTLGIGVLVGTGTLYKKLG